MKVVINSSVLIILDKIKKISILKELFDEIIIPKAVYNEVSKKHSIPPWIKIEDVKTKFILPILRAKLHAGESESIILAIEKKADFVALDDFEARKIAKKLGLRVIGTIGILLLAKKRGVIKENIGNLLDLLEINGFYLSEKIKKEIIKAFGDL